jgi:hypothetical protein
VPQPSLGSSLQSFSLTGIARLSRGPLSRSLAPLQLSTSGVKRAALRRSPWVSSTPTPSRGCLSPPRTMDFLSVDRGPLSGRPGLCAAELTSPRQLHLLRSLHPPVRPYQRLQVTSAAGRFSPGLFPFGAFPSTPRILDPPGQVLVWARSLVRRLGSATRRTIDPTSRVRPPSALVHKKISSTGSNLLRRMVRTASRRRLLLSWPWTWGSPHPDLQSFGVCGK